MPEIPEAVEQGIKYPSHVINGRYGDEIVRTYIATLLRAHESGNDRDTFNPARIGDGVKEGGTHE